jgi:Protein of unknown function (DUF1403)
LNIIGHCYYQTGAALSTNLSRQKRRHALRWTMVRTPQMPVAQTVFQVPPPLPGWARNEPPVTDTEAYTGAAFQVGAALAMLDCRVRAEVPFAGVWRRRLALKAAAASARIARRGEDEATLRDVFFLRHGGDDPGPAGRMLVAWRGLDRSAPLADDSVFHLAETLQLKMDDGLRAAIAEVQQLAASTQAAPFAGAQAARIVALQPGAGILALWLADAVLAVRLKWPRPLPLIASALMHPSLRSGGHRPCPGDPNWTRSCCIAYGRAAAQACDPFAELARSSQKLIAVAPRLRARGAGAVIETLLNEDAVLASARRGAISARGSRRLFDRLVALGGVRELTGRSTFRLYGL